MRRAITVYNLLGVKAHADFSCWHLADVAGRASKYRRVLTGCCG